MTRQLNNENSLQARWTIPLAITAPKKNGGGSAYRNIVQLINFGEYRQFCASNPPLLLAANRYSQF